MTTIDEELACQTSIKEHLAALDAKLTRSEASLAPLVAEKQFRDNLDRRVLKWVKNLAIVTGIISAIIILSGQLINILREALRP